MGHPSHEDSDEPVEFSPTEARQGLRADRVVDMLIGGIPGAAPTLGVVFACLA
jgi:hypothetical protein